MSHVAIIEIIDGKNVEGMEPVTDDQYLGSTLVIAWKAEVSGGGD